MVVRHHVWLAALCIVSVHGAFPLSIPLSVAEKGMQKQQSSKDTGVIEARNARFPEWPCGLGTVRYGAALGQFSVWRSVFEPRLGRNRALSATEINGGKLGKHSSLMQSTPKESVILKLNITFSQNTVTLSITLNSKWKAMIFALYIIENCYQSLNPLFFLYFSKVVLDLYVTQQCFMILNFIY